MQIISYNVNGIRAAEKKGLSNWLKAASPDVLLLQETKAQFEQIDQSPYRELGYEYQHYHSAEKKGYSGVGILSKQEPDHIEIGTGIDYIDREGRVIRADFGEVSVMSVYIPSGSSGDIRQDLKMQFLSDFETYISELLKTRPHLIIGGDFNICRQAVDIHNPSGLQNVSGFLPEERAWVSQFLKLGFIDSFRHFYPETAEKYSWWSYRANSRNRNKGWRIDYNMVSKKLEHSLKRAAILSEAKHSDHCPILVEIDWTS